jgi:hypothetical protein
MPELMGDLGRDLLELGPHQVAIWWGIYTSVAAAGWLLLADQHRRQTGDRMFAWWLWHWYTGGTLATTRAERVGALPRAGLAVARTTATIAVATVVFVAAGGLDTGLPLVVAGPAITAGVTVWTWSVVCVAVAHAHDLQWIKPTHGAVHKLAQWDESQRPKSYLRIRRELADGGDGVFVYVSPTFAWKDTDCLAIEHAVVSKLDLGDVNIKRVPRGKHGYIRFWPKAPMPNVVRFSDPDIRELVERAKPSAPLFGIGRGGIPIYVDIDSDSPHLLLSAGTGGGKSWTLHMLAAQLMAHGAETAVLDHKRHSHRWIRHLEGDGALYYAREMEEIHTTLVKLGEEAERRNRLWDEVDIDDRGAPEYPRMIVICEELNATMHQLKAYWRTIRPRGDTDQSGPAVGALRNILYMGRAVRVHIFAVAQMAIANDLGGPAARENFRVRMFNKSWSKQNWDMLSTAEYRAPTGRDGRGFVVVGDQATECQFVKMTPHEARALVMAHRNVRVRPKAAAGVRAESVSLGEQPRHVAVPRQLDGGVEPVTLWQASKDKGRGIVDLNYSALSTAARRDRDKGTFPEPVVDDPSRPGYDPRDLQRWELRRPLARPAADGSSYVQGDVISLSSRLNEVKAGTEGPEVESTRGPEWQTT